MTSCSPLRKSVSSTTAFTTGCNPISRTFSRSTSNSDLKTGRTRMWATLIFLHLFVSANSFDVKTFLSACENGDVTIVSASFADAGEILASNESKANLDFHTANHDSNSDRSKNRNGENDWTNHIADSNSNFLNSDQSAPRSFNTKPSVKSPPIFNAAHATIDVAQRRFDSHPSTLLSAPDLAIHRAEVASCLRLAAWRGRLPVVTLALRRIEAIRVAEKEREIESERFWRERNSLRPRIVRQFVAETKGIARRLDFDLSATPTLLDSLLLLSSSRGHLNLTLFLIEAGADPAAADDAGWTPLHWACRRGDLEAAAALVDAGAPLNASEFTGATPLHRATEANSLGAAMALVEAGADIDAGNRAGKTPLHLAGWHGFFSMTFFLLKNGAVPNSKDRKGWTPLHAASWRGQLDLMLILLRNGADKNLSDRFGRTPLYYASFKGHAEVVKLLVSDDAHLYFGAPPNTPNDFTSPPSNSLSQSNIPSIDSRLADAPHGLPVTSINAPDSRGRTALHAAVEKGFVRVVEVLLEAGADPNVVDSRGRAPLHIAISKGFINILFLLDEAGAKQNVKDKNGVDPLQMAAGRFGRFFDYSLERRTSRG